MPRLPEVFASLCLQAGRRTFGRKVLDRKGHAALSGSLRKTAATILCSRNARGVLPHYCNNRSLKIHTLERVGSAPRAIYSLVQTIQHGVFTADSYIISMFFLNCKFTHSS